MSDEGNETEYGLVMPFVVCASQGGPFDDDAYVAGYEAGLLDARLSSVEYDSLLVEGHLDGVIHAGNQPQVDLIAMKHDLVAQFEEAGDGWLYLTLRRGATLTDTKEGE
jgi:hypothetical protein